MTIGSWLVRPTYELITVLEANTGLKSGWLRTVIPNSVSVPRTFGMATFRSQSSQVLAGSNSFDGATFPVAFDQRAHVDDALPLLA